MSLKAKIQLKTIFIFFLKDRQFFLLPMGNNVPPYTTFKLSLSGIVRINKEPKHTTTCSILPMIIAFNENCSLADCFCAL